MTDYPLEPMADVVTARLRMKPEPATSDVVELGVVVEPMPEVVTARLRRVTPRLSKVGAP